MQKTFSHSEGWRLGAHSALLGCTVVLSSGVDETCESAQVLAETAIALASFEDYFKVLAVAPAPNKKARTLENISDFVFGDLGSWKNADVCFKHAMNGVIPEADLATVHQEVMASVSDELVKNLLEATRAASQKMVDELVESAEVVALLGLEALVEGAPQLDAALQVEAMKIVNSSKASRFKQNYNAWYADKLTPGRATAQLTSIFPETMKSKCFLSLSTPMASESLRWSTLCWPLLKARCAR